MFFLFVFLLISVSAAIFEQDQYEGSTSYRFYMYGVKRTQRQVLTSFKYTKGQGLCQRNMKKLEKKCSARRNRGWIENDAIKVVVFYGVTLLGQL
jgi:hypothetical protein